MDSTNTSFVLRSVTCHLPKAVLCYRLILIANIVEVLFFPRMDANRIGTILIGLPILRGCQRRGHLNSWLIMLFKFFQYTIHTRLSDRWLLPAWKFIYSNLPSDIASLHIINNYRFSRKCSMLTYIPLPVYAIPLKQPGCNKLKPTQDRSG